MGVGIIGEVRRGMEILRVVCWPGAWIQRLGTIIIRWRNVGHVTARRGVRTSTSGLY